MKKSRLTKTNSYEYATSHLPRKSYMMSQLNQEQRLAQGIADYRKNIGYNPENRMDTFENYKICTIGIPIPLICTVDICGLAESSLVFFVKK